MNVTSHTTGNKMKGIFFILLFHTILSCFLSCSENDCSLGGRPSARFTFLNSKNGKVINLFDSLTVTALGTDSILLNRGKAINHIILPLSYVNQETTFILHYTRFLRDTIWVTHENFPHFISIDCGVSMFYHLRQIQYTTFLLDSILLVNPDINDNEKENCRIYYTPDN